MEPEPYLPGQARLAAAGAHVPIKVIDDCGGVRPQVARARTHVRRDNSPATTACWYDLRTTGC